jgi:uncharacterized protein YeaO (DUF488 family)
MLERRNSYRGRQEEEMPSRRPSVTVGRVYDTSPDDAIRVLVDRVWPRGLRKEQAHLAEWCKDVAPSTELRRWYGHDPERFDEFGRRYRRELAQQPQASALEHLEEMARKGPVVLLTATKDVEISQAAVLADVLRARR